MAWAVADDVKTVLRGILAKASVSNLSDRWTPIIDQALLQAKSDILTLLVTRGYAPSQVVAWEYTFTFHVRQTIYWCLVFGASMHPYEDRFIEKLDIREMLLTVTLTSGDDLLAPNLLTNIASVGELDWDGLGLNFAPENEQTIREGARDIGCREY